MILRIKKKALEQSITGILAILLLIFIFTGVSFTTNYVSGIVSNYSNVTVYAFLNVTNTPPNITAVSLDDDDPTPATTIDLTADGITVVTCNATVFDYDGWQDIDPDSTNATIYIESVGNNASDDNNSHYTNRSCGRCTIGSTSTEAGCDCRFGVQYYANASTNWYCNISVTDRGGTSSGGDELNFSDFGVSTATILTELIAINVSTDILDYGNLSVTEVSAALQRNVSNVGNTDFNLTLRGYGGDNESIGQNSTMICDLGNISFGYHRYVVGENVSFGIKKNLTNQTVDTNFTIYQRVNDNSAGTRIDLNTTFWNLEIPLTVGGICNGSIVFGAIQSI